MIDPILIRARILTEAARRGDYDRGTYITRWLPQAEAELLREREEVSDAD